MAGTNPNTNRHLLHHGQALLHPAGHLGVRGSGLHWSSLRKSVWSTRTYNVKDKMLHFLENYFLSKERFRNQYITCCSNFYKKVCVTNIFVWNIFEPICALSRSNYLNSYDMAMKSLSIAYPLNNVLPLVSIKHIHAHYHFTCINWIDCSFAYYWCFIWSFCPFSVNCSDWNYVLINSQEVRGAQ